jgi:SAM-dependent methyltransferase
MDASLYEEHARFERDHWWFVGRRAIVEHVLRERLPAAADRRILDAGCGTGGMLPMLAGLGHVEALESEPVAVAHCKEAFGFEVTLGRIPDDVPTDRSFDLVTAFDVIEHIDDDRAAVEALRRALRPGGVLAVTVPALPWLWSAHDEVNDHKRRYTRATLLDLLARCDLRVTHTSYFNTALLPVVAGARLTQRVRPRATPRSDITMPSPRVNAALTSVFAAERRLVASRGLPLGASLLALATPTA